MNLNSKDKKDFFLHFLLISILSVIVFNVIIFYKSTNEVNVSKEDLDIKITENNDFEQSTLQVIKLIDTTARLIHNYNSNVTAVFLKRDIQNNIASIKTNFDRNAHDKRFKIYNQNSELLSMLFFDKQELKGNDSDQIQLKEALNNCIISKRQLQQSLNFK